MRFRLAFGALLELILDPFSLFLGSKINFFRILLENTQHQNNLVKTSSFLKLHARKALDLLNTELSLGRSLQLVRTTNIQSTRIVRQELAPRTSVRIIVPVSVIFFFAGVCFEISVKKKIIAESACFKNSVVFFLM